MGQRAIKHMLEQFDFMRDGINSELQYYLSAVENSGIEEPGVWFNGFKFEETSKGDKIFYYNSGSGGIYKLAMYEDGANEIIMPTSYSYLKGDRFIWMSINKPVRYMEFDSDGALKRGVLAQEQIVNGVSSAFIDSFEGDD